MIQIFHKFMLTTHGIARTLKGIQPGFSYTLGIIIWLSTTYRFAYINVISNKPLTTV